MNQPPSIPSPFLRLFSMLVFSVVAYFLQWLFSKLGDIETDHRKAMRQGIAGGFVWAGVDHFIHTSTTYLPMLPEFLHPYAGTVIYGTGVCEILAAIGLLVPQGVYRRLDLPNFVRFVGIMVVLLLGGLSIANINVALKATAGQGFAFAAWLYWLRIAFQGVLIVMALYASEVIAREPFMKIFVFDPEKHWPEVLAELKTRPLSYTKDTVLRERRTIVDIPAPSGIRDLRAYVFSSLFDYQIFPPQILRALGEWQLHGRTMEPGDIILQQAMIPPWPIGLKFVFAVRVLELFHEPNKIGFSYGTLAGHAEMGISEFYLSLEKDGSVRANIHTFSYPGTWLTRLLAPIFTLPYQQYCTNAGLARIRAAAAEVLAGQRAPTAVPRGELGVEPIPHSL